MDGESITLEEYFADASDEDIISYIAGLEDIEPVLPYLVASNRHSLILRIYDTPEYNNSRSHWVNLAIEAHNYNLFAELMKTPIRESYKVYRKYFRHIFGSPSAVVYIATLKIMRPEVLESPYFFYLVTRYANRLEYNYVVEKVPIVKQYIGQVLNLVNDRGDAKIYDFEEAYEDNRRL